MVRVPRSVRALASAGVLTLVLGALSGCGGPKSTQSNQAGCPNESLPTTCPAPVPTYVTDVEPLITRACLPCHSSANPTNNGPLDSYATLVSMRTPVLSQTYACIMPPPGSPALTLPERLTLFTWLTCGVPQN